MKKVLAFGASLSKISINQQLAEFAATIIENVTADVIKLPDFYPMEMYGMQEELPANAQKMYDVMSNYDGFIISLAEHNGTYTAAFKNALDWLSTIGDQDGVFQKKPVLIMGTAPGPKGAQFVIEAAKSRFPWNGASDVLTYSLPIFQKNFANGTITNPEKLKELQSTLAEFVTKL